MQAPQRLEQLHHALFGITGIDGHLLHIHRAQTGKYTGIEPQNGAQDIVEVLAFDTQRIEVVAADTEHKPCGILLVVREDEVTVLLEHLQRILHRSHEETVTGTEIVQVHRHRAEFPLPDGHPEIIHQPDIDILYLRYGGKFGGETACQTLPVVGSDDEHGIGTTAVPSGPPGLLIILLQRSAEPVMHHEADVGLVDSHAECVGGHHHPRLSRRPFVLPQGPLAMRQPRMVILGRNTLLLQLRGKQLRGVTRPDIDDSAPRHIPYHPQQLPLPVIRMPDGKRQVRPGVIAPDDVGLAERQLLHDILRHRLRSRSRQREHGHRRQDVAHPGDTQVSRTEVVPPLRDTVRLIHRYQIHVHLGQPGREQFARHPFGRDVQEFDVAVHAIVERDVDVARTHAGVDGDRRDTAAAQRIDLVLHQRHERRHDHAQPLHQQTGKLVGQRLAATGRHQRKGIPAFEHAPNRPGLRSAQRTVPPIPPQGFEQLLLRDGLPVHTAKLIRNPRIS